MPRGAAGALQRFMHFFLPKEEEFFGLFAEMADKAHEGAQLLQKMVGEYPAGAEEAMAAIDAVEHEVDTLRHNCIQRLHDTFVTPILLDRTDIFDLGDMLDDIVDFTKAAADRMVFYKVKEVPEAIRGLAGIFVECTADLKDACACLEKLKPNECAFVARVNGLENQADHLLKQGLADLFENQSDPVEIIKWKEIYDYIEEAIDHCEDTANLIQGALVKNS